MGLIPPDPPPDYGPGNDCSHCWEPGHTPNYVFIRFWDITACPGSPAAPNGIAFVCAQVAVSPCTFRGDITFRGNTWRAEFVAAHMPVATWISSIQLSVLGLGLTAFFAEDATPCNEIFENPYTVCPAWGGGGGRAIVEVFDTAIIIGLTNHYHFCTNPGVRYEKWKVGIDHSVFRLANVNGHTNCLFLIDREDFVIMPPDHWPHP